jgi:tRNA (guanine26-N2/guanine27-N2)-dimethyltransferase
VLDLLAASGIRGLRIKKEVSNVDVTLNDYSKKAAKLIKKNAKLNKLSVKIENKAANVLLSELNTYDYIDLDPFGTPVPFLDSAIKRLSPHGVIGVTATDTSALCGAAPKACLRKYGSKPLRNEFMHETAVRILIKKCQEVAAQYDVALIPIFSHSSNHYVRVYLQKAGGAKKADEILKQHGHVLYCPKCCYRNTTTNLLSEANKCSQCSAKLDHLGKVWLGELWDRKLVKQMINNTEKAAVSKQTIKLLETIYAESAIKTVGFYDLHTLAKKNKWKQVPRMQTILDKTKGTRTHFRLTGIRTKKLLLS